jgi:hypothetical protein
MLDDQLCQWVRGKLRATKHTLLSRFELELTSDEIMSVITTHKQRAALDTIRAFIADECVAKVYNWQLPFWLSTTSVRGQGCITFVSNNWASQLLPNSNAATGVFSNVPDDNPVKQKILDHAELLKQLALPWAQAEDGFHELAVMATEPEQVVFYAPWVRSLVDNHLVDRKGDKVDYKWREVGDRSLTPTIRRLHKAARPKQYLVLTPEQRKYLSAPSGEFAKLSLLGDPSSKLETHVVFGMRSLQYAFDSPFGPPNQITVDIFAA